MNKKQYALMIVFALIGGLIGGALSNKVFHNEIAFAQNNNKIITAEEFLLVDKKGKIKGSWRTDEGCTNLILYDKSLISLGNIKSRSIFLSCSEKSQFLSFQDKDDKGIVLESELGVSSLRFSNKLKDLKRNIVHLAYVDTGAFLKLAPPKGGYASIGIDSAKGEPLAGLKLIKGSPTLLLVRENSGMFWLDVESDGPNMEFCDKSKNKRIKLSVEDDNAHISFYDNAKKGKMALGVLDDKPGIHLGEEDFGIAIGGVDKYNYKIWVSKEGRIIWSRP